MPFQPTPAQAKAQAHAALRIGLGVGIRDDDALWVAFAAETLNPDQLSQALDLGGAEMIITHRRAETLKTAAYFGDVARLTIQSDADLRWIRGVADPATDLSTPMKGPFRSLRNGDPRAHRAAILLCKAAHLLPAAVMVRVQSAEGLSILTASEVLAQADTAHYNDIVHAALPMAVSNEGRVHVFRPDDGSAEHYAIEVGKIDPNKPILTRLHSACFTGDLLGSLKCDCGPQLRGAMAQMGAQGAGILLYLNQEGRGIGLANKMRAYFLQDQGFDTVEANHRIGFEDDERDFRIGASILNKLGVGNIKLLTNNPNKVARMEDMGITVSERVPLIVGENPVNSAYLKTKAAKSGHLL